MMNVFEKLMTVQSKLKAPKGNYNSFGKYSYRSCEDILEAVKPLLAEVKAILTMDDTVQQIGDRYYILATARFTDAETSEFTSVSAYAREEQDKKGMDAAQVTGSVSSYARKYALNGLFCIDDTKDSDATNTHGKEFTPNVDKPNLSENQLKRLYAIAGKKGYTAESVKKVILKKYSVMAEEMTKEQYDETVSGYEGLPDKK